MKQVAQNSPLRLFYHTDGLETGQSVIFDIWNDSGIQLYDDVAATEIGAEGVYYLDITSPASDLYLLVVGSNNHFYPKAEVIKVGSPNLKAFYVQGTFKAGLTIPYEIYNESDTVLASGNLTSIVSGFYSANTEGLVTPWFLEVPPWAMKNQEDLQAK